MKLIHLTFTEILSCLCLIAQLIFDPNIKATIAQQNPSCQEVIRSSETRLMGDRPQDQIRPPEGVRGESQNLNLRTQIEDISRRYQGYPLNRSLGVNFILDGSRGDEIMDSPQIMQEISQSIITNCSNTGTVSFVRRYSDWIYIYGIVDDRIIRFTCLLGEPGSSQPSWGQHQCL